jgi:hypothetical protein
LSLISAQSLPSVSQAVSENFRKTCTGSVVGPALVLSAAHCLFNPRTGLFFPVGSVHFLIGYEGGSYLARSNLDGGANRVPNARRG